MRIELLNNMKIDKNWSLARIARENKCDYRTVKRYLKLKAKGITKIRRKPISDALQKEIETIIRNDENVSASRIYRMIKFKTPARVLSERQMRRRVALVKKDYGPQAQIPLRINHQPGKTAQIDWKESQKIELTTGETVTFNVLAIKLPYSGKVVFEVTKNRNQASLLSALALGLERLGGVPQELKFDNMKTVVNHTQSFGLNKTYNHQIIQFGNDYNVRIKTTEIYNPQGKGAVETQMKLVQIGSEAIGKFASMSEIKNYIMRIETDYNQKLKTNEKLGPLPHSRISTIYKQQAILVKVNRTAMITYRGKSYSVNPIYIGQKLYLEETESKSIRIYDQTKTMIREYQASPETINYQITDLKEVLKQQKYMKYKNAKQSFDDFVLEQFKKFKGEKNEHY